MRVVQFGTKDSHLLEQAVNRVFVGLVAISIDKYSSENKVLNNQTNPIRGTIPKQRLQDCTEVAQNKRSILCEQVEYACDVIFSTVKTRLPCASSGR